MTIYIAIELADERYCDGCVCLGREDEVVLPGPYCMGQDGVTDEGYYHHWLRPQACIDASAEIASRQGSLDNCPEADTGPWSHITIDGKLIPEGGLRDAIAEAEAARRIVIDATSFDDQAHHRQRYVTGPAGDRPW